MKVGILAQVFHNTTIIMENWLLHAIDRLEHAS